MQQEDVFVYINAIPFTLGAPVLPLAPITIINTFCVFFCYFFDEWFTGKVLRIELQQF